MCYTYMMSLAYLIIRLAEKIVGRTVPQVTTVFKVNHVCVLVGLIKVKDFVKRLVRDKDTIRNRVNSLAQTNNI